MAFVVWKIEFLDISICWVLSLIWNIEYYYCSLRMEFSYVFLIYRGFLLCSILSSSNICWPIMSFESSVPFLLSFGHVLDLCVLLSRKAFFEVLGMVTCLFYLWCRVFWIMSRLYGFVTLVLWNGLFLCMSCYQIHAIWFLSMSECLVFNQKSSFFWVWKCYWNNEI